MVVFRVIYGFFSSVGRLGLVGICRMMKPAERETLKGWVGGGNGIGLPIQMRRGIKAY